MDCAFKIFPYVVVINATIPIWGVSIKIKITIRFRFALDMRNYLGARKVTATASSDAGFSDTGADEHLVFSADRGSRVAAGSDGLARALNRHVWDGEATAWAPLSLLRWLTQMRGDAPVPASEPRVREWIERTVAHASAAVSRPHRIASERLEDIPLETDSERLL